MSSWDKNSKILINKYPGLLEVISAEDDDLTADIKIETAPTGDPTLCINGIYIHSQRDPVKEGQRLAQAAAQAAAQNAAQNAAQTAAQYTHSAAADNPVVILGFGLGYAAQAAAAVGAEKRPIIIVEKHKKILRLAFELRDLTDLLLRENIIFVVGGQADGILNVLAIVNETFYRQAASAYKAAESAGKNFVPSVIRNRALFDLDKEWYKIAEDKIRTWRMKDEVNAATLKRFGRRWERNLSHNISAFRDYPGVSRLAGLAAGDPGGAQTEKQAGAQACKPHLPVFLAAAGPSLDNIKPLLRDIYDRFIIIAVDTNLRFFTNNGIFPDFVIAADPQFLNSRHLDRCSCEQTVLIADPVVYPPVLRLPFKRIFLFGSSYPPAAAVENQIDPKGRLASGGSVATTAWDFARTLITAESSAKSAAESACKDIWIAGLDLAFPGYKTHFRGARFEEKANSESCRFNPVETWVVRALRNGVPFKARSCKSSEPRGGEVLTDKRLSLYAAWFENQFKQHREIRNLALFHEGLEIAGLHAATTVPNANAADAAADALLALPPLRREIDMRLEAALARIDAEFNEAQKKRKRQERYSKYLALDTE